MIVRVDSRAIPSSSIHAPMVGTFRSGTRESSGRCLILPLGGRGGERVANQTHISLEKERRALSDSPSYIQVSFS